MNSSTAATAAVRSTCRLATRLTPRRTFASSSRVDASYGFIGLGAMGYPMARNLRTKIPKDDQFFVYDSNLEATKKFSEELPNVSVAQNVRDVAVNASTVITVLPEPYHVQNVFQQMLRPPTLRNEPPNTRERLFIDCSTIDPKSSVEVATATHSSGQGKFVDAPVSGGVVGARAGTLTFMIGAAPELVDRVNEVLGMMGKRVVHLGPQSSGLKGKLANNYLLALNNIATAEAMNMGVKWGLDPAKLADMINTATGKCWPSEVNNPVPGVIEDSPASREYEGGFGTALMLKDLNLALLAAAEADIVPRLGPHAKDIYAAVEGDEKLRGKDFSVVYKYVGGRGL